MWPAKTPLVASDQQSGKLLGAQLVGACGTETAKRVDTYATALFHNMTVDGLSELDRSYTPALGSPALIAGHLEPTARLITPGPRPISCQSFYFVPVTVLRFAMTLVATRPASSVSILPRPNCATVMTLCPSTIPTTSPTMINIPAPP